jgi:hypothetical protein
MQLAKTNLSIIAGLIMAASLSTNAFAFGERWQHKNAEGGHTAGAVHAYQGENGGEFAKGHRIKSDGQGNVTRSSGAAGSTANGGQYKRTSQSTHSADGSATHQGSISASGSKGSVSSSGSATKNADGSVNQSRTTEITNAQTGVTRDSSTSYTSGQGVSHTATCTDASGASVPCPTH